MKRLAWLIIMVSLVVIAFFQYKKYKRFNPPSEYTYPQNDSIDVQFYDALMVQHYYNNVYTIESTARRLWFERGVDIRFPDLEIEGTAAELEYYNQLWATTRLIEDKLVYSTRLKSLGFNNQEIRDIIENELSESEYRSIPYESLLWLQQGNKGYSVWQLQNFLLGKGYELPYDGVFGIETHQQLIELQKKHQLIPSGIVDPSTLEKLIE